MAIAGALRYNGGGEVERVCAGMAEFAERDDLRMIPLYDRAAKKRRWPIITWLLVLINVLVFIYELRLSPTALTCVINDYSVIPKYLSVFLSQPSDPHCAAYSTPAPVVLTAISAMFLHAGWLHIAGNMLFLLIFGDNVEDHLGRVGYALFYLACGVAGTAAQVAVAPHATVAILGASGAIAGVLAAYFVLFPSVRVRTLLLVIVIDLPAWLLIGLWILFQALDGLATFQATANSTDGVAFFAHLGGFAAGLVIALIYRWFAPRTPAAKSNEAPKASS